MFLIFFGVFVLARWNRDSAVRLLATSQSELFESDEPDEIRMGERHAITTNQKYKRNVTPLTKKKAAARGNWKCQCGCNKPLSFDYHIDHITPLWQGGDNSEQNLRALNPGCHLQITALQNQV